MVEEERPKIYCCPRCKSGHCSAGYQKIGPNQAVIFAKCNACMYGGQRVVVIR